jgi:methyl-accepting chemotaxis protein
MSTILHPGMAAPVARSMQPASDGGFFAHHGIWAPGVRLFRKLAFTAKATIISLAFIVPLLGLLAWQIKTQNEQAMQSRMDATRQHVEIAHGLIAWAHAQETAGKMPRKQAQQLARQVVSKLRYDGNEYFWINDMQPARDLPT